MSPPMAGNSPAAQISSIRNQLDHLYWISRGPEAASAGDFSAAIREYKLLYDSFRVLDGYLESLSIGDSQRIVNEIEDWNNLFREIDPIAREQRDAFSKGNATSTNSSLNTNGQICLEKVKLIRCKLQLHAADLHVNRTLSYKQSEDLELARKLIVLHKQENTLSSQIHDLERSSGDIGIYFSNEPSQTSRPTTQSRNERYSWSAGDGDPQTRRQLLQELGSQKKEIEELKKKLAETLRNHNECEKVASSYEELKKEHAEALRNHNECEKAAKTYEELYNMKAEETAKLRAKGDEEAENADKMEKESFRIGHELVAMLLKYSQPRFSRAGEVISTILHRQKEMFGGNHPNTRSSHQLYCTILRRQAFEEKKIHHLEKSEALYRKVESMHRLIWLRQDAAHVLDANDEWVLDNGYNLALVLADQGGDKEKEAVMQHDRVWNGRREIFGATGDATVESALQLISILDKQTEKEMPEKAGNIRKVLNTVWNGRTIRTSDGVLNCGARLGLCKYEQKKYDEAETILNEVWNARKNHPGETHIDTMSSGYYLALSLFLQKTPEKCEKAKTVFERLWELRSPMAEDTFPALDSIGYYFAWSLYKLDECIKALPVITQVWEMRKKDLRRENPTTLNVYYLLGLTQHQLEDYGAAEETFLEIWTRERADPKANPASTFKIGHMLGDCRMKQQEFHLAQEILRIVHEGRVGIGAKASDIERTRMLLDEAEQLRPIVDNDGGSSEPSEKAPEEAGTVPEVVEVPRRPGNTTRGRVARPRGFRYW